jgi:hypothetical protein
MPSVSKAQQAIMGQAWAIRQGDLKLKDLNPRWRDEIKKIAFGYKDDAGKFIAPMTDKELKKYASTKSKDLPEKVEDGKPVDESVNIETGIVSSNGVPGVEPGMNPGGGIKPIIPYLNPDSKKPKGKKKLQHLADYRDWIKSNK